jgi:hypothetical protein
MQEIQKTIIGLNEKAYTAKVSGKVLQFTNTAAPPPLFKKRSRRGNWKKNALPKLYSIPTSQPLAFASFLPLHALWTSYILKLLGPSSTWTSISVLLPTLVRADYHGAIVSIARSKIPSLVGMEGMVLKENKLNFEILTRGGTSTKSE